MIIITKNTTLTMMKMILVYILVAMLGSLDMMVIMFMRSSMKFMKITILSMKFTMNNTMITTNTITNIQSLNISISNLTLTVWIANTVKHTKLRPRVNTLDQSMHI